ncbi:MAG: binding--dependent transport system inner rane component family protein [Cypionkella sp.]|uniref:carbohydrate ABC transporter permease n=1 Tax=Cypionkella sp. TaxID=2811411 RepID=UPI0026143DE2|nr:sugar ABC transporter permease [Cypionkella sp.]MDB5659432.1 binding--dependent transport system inner rane component family protein [Cypionkella sp.]
MRRRMVIIFLAPAVLLYLFFVLAPAAASFYLSLFQTSGFGETPRWVGFGNYIKLFSDPVFWLSITNMALILTVGGVAIFGLAFLFTILINSGIWGKKLFRALIFMPNVIAVVALSTFWSFIYMPRYGMLSNIFKYIGFDQAAAISWTAPENIIWSMLIGLVWISTGFFTILILAGADKIPTDMYEAARIEGAGPVQMFRMITVPMIWDVIAITMVLWVIEAIKMMEFPFAFGGPTPVQSLLTPSIYLFIMGFGFRQPVYELGYATAIGVCMFLFTVVAVLILTWATRRDRVEF